MGLYSTKKDYIFQGKETSLGKYVYLVNRCIWYVYSIIQEDLEKILNKKVVISGEGHK